MSPGNCGVFQIPDRGEISKNSGILQLVKMGAFWGAWSTACALLVGWWRWSKSFLHTCGHIGYNEHTSFCGIL